ncbi:MAG TPA: hypothetical protein VFG07_05550, partial [Thermoplasmata archaeon]|nr:hypothetical protein [Thermoplasmata archaeon]
YCFGWENWTLNASHHYWILVTFTSYTWVNDYNYAPASALVASIAPGGSSVGMWRITSLTVR